MFIIFWNNNPQNLRAANRNRNTTENRNNNQDFRVARTFLARAVGVMVSAIGRSFALPISNQHTNRVIARMAGCGTKGVFAAMQKNGPYTVHAHPRLRLFAPQPDIVCRGHL
jgi:hypothetical protein